MVRRDPVRTRPRGDLRVISLLVACLLPLALATASPLAAARPAGPSGGPALASSAAASPSPSARPVSTTTELTAGAVTVPTGATVELIATVTPNPGGGSVVFRDAPEPAFPLATASIAVATGTAGTIVTLTPGTHVIRAIFTGTDGFTTSTSRTVVAIGLNAGSPTTTTVEAVPESAEVHTAMIFTATVSPEGTTGDVVFTDGTSVLGTAEVAAETGKATMTTRFPTPGSRTVTAAFLGGGTVGGSRTSIQVDVTEETGVQVEDVGLSAGSVYPVKDGYRDTLTVHGTTLEAARVSIAVVALATRKTVRKVDLGTRSGDYRWVWNGRSGSGALVAAGRYEIRQTFVDGTGHRLTSIDGVVVSMKKLHPRTSDQTLYGAEAESLLVPYTFNVFRVGSSLTAYENGLHPGMYPGETGEDRYVESQIHVAYRFDRPRMPSGAIPLSVSARVHTACPAGHDGASVSILGATSARVGCVPGWHTLKARIANEGSFPSPAVVDFWLQAAPYYNDGITIDAVQMTWTWGVLR